jgi:hypothetical protein
MQLREGRAEKERRLDVQLVFDRLDIRGGAEYRDGLQLVALNPFPTYVEKDDNRAITLEAPELKVFCESLTENGETGMVTLVGFYVETGTQERHNSEPKQFDIEKMLAWARATESAGETGDLPDQGKEVR